MITLLTADDHPIIQEGLERWLSVLDDIELLGSAYSLDALLAMLETCTPDVIIMDYRMPGVLGAESIRELCDKGHTVIMFTSTEEQVIVDSLCDGGISAFVHKSSSIATLIDVVRRVAAGERVLPEEHMRAPLPHQRLSERETLVFKGLIARKPPKEIAFELGLATSSIYTYAERVRAKLGAPDNHALIQYAYDTGLLEKKPHEA